ncbi:MAG: acriflavin resistance protein [Acidobacteria bacterium]|nr:MAG: acriflavin resistance protein [Acidobacteriota bacterium]
MTYDPQSATTKLTRFSLKRRITVLVLFMSVLVVGAIATRNIPLELVPAGYAPQFLQVRVPWRNAPTPEVLEKVTLPLEEELSTVRGLSDISSYTRVGFSQVFLRFKLETDMNVAYREVKDRVERARQQFPSDVDRVFIRKDDSSGVPVSFIGITYDSSQIDAYDLIQKEIVLPFSRIDGVATVNTEALEEKEILIELDKELTEANNLNIYELSQALSQDNFTMASGQVKDSGKKYLLRSMAQYRSLKELENKMLSPTVRLKDVATIKYEELEKRYMLRVNSKPAVAVLIMKEGEANTVEISKKIKETLKQIQANPRLADFDIKSLFNQGEVIEESLFNLVDSGKIGGLLAAMVMFLFLRRVRMTLIIALSIPLSLLIALVVMFFANESLNILTMLGLVICVGLLVDNSVVVAENIFRLHSDGLDRRQACIQGASEIALAITMATLTTVVVFLPVSLVSGQGQFFLIRLAMPISVSLIASLFIALVFVPLSVFMVLPSKTRTPKFKALDRWHRKGNLILKAGYDRIFGRANKFYNKLLAFFMRHRVDLVIILVTLFIATFTFVKDKVQTVEKQEEDETNFQIHVSSSNEYHFEELKTYFLECEKVLEKKQEQYNLEGFMVLAYSSGGRIEGWMPRGKKSAFTVKEITKDIGESLPKKPGIKLFYGEDNQMQDNDKKDTFVLRLVGEDAEALEDVAKSIEPLFLAQQGVIGLKKVGDDAPSEMAFVVDRDQAAMNRVNPSVIAGVISYAIMGSTLPKYNDNGKQIPVRVRYKEENRQSVGDLENFLVPTDDGNVISLESLTKVEMRNVRKGVFRRNKKVTHSMTFELEEKKTEEIKKRLKNLMTQLDLPEGMTFSTEDSSQKNQDIESLQFAMLISTLFIYFLMGFLFESFILPLSIITTIPLAAIGVFWIHFATGKDLDFLGYVGMILLIGVVVNNGIVLIDYVNRLRADGMSRTKAILHAADKRFRPIVITALTTVIGMIPLTISDPNSLGISYKSFGLTLIGGMTTATLLTLLVVPVFYTLFDDCRNYFTNLLGQALRRKEAHRKVPS